MDDFSGHFFGQFPNLVVLNLVVCNIYAEPLFCALLRPFALFCGLAFVLFCVHLRSFALICVFLQTTAITATAFGNCRFCPQKRDKNPETKSAKKTGGPKRKIREKSVLPRTGPNNGAEMMRRETIVIV